MRSGGPLERFARVAGPGGGMGLYTRAQRKNEIVAENPTFPTLSTLARPSGEFLGARNPTQGAHPTLNARHTSGLPMVACATIVAADGRLCHPN